MARIIRAILDNNVDDRFACLISDDTHPDTLISDGHLDHIVRCAVKEGLDPVKAIQYVTINPATCFHMDHEMGSISPGKCADIVFFDDLNDIRITRTIIDGDVVAENGNMTVDIGKADFPDSLPPFMIPCMWDRQSLLTALRSLLLAGRTVLRHA